ncbi:MAG TPA: hypothetical protein VLL08_11410 [Kineosporiaceae bacterium]|nr:hypothetical protein [Kineosporiaceae bacterium]
MPDYVTVSYNRFHDHYKVILIGASDDDGAVDTGKLHVSVDHNSFTNVKNAYVTHADSVPDRSSKTPVIPPAT